MKKWKYLFRSYFGFSKKETNGFIILIGILFLTLLITIGISKFYPEPELTTAEDKKVLALLLSKASAVNSISTNNDNQEAETPLENIFFDPNLVDAQTLEKIVGKKLTGTIINYRTKGGHFYRKEDLLKI